MSAEEFDRTLSRMTVEQEVEIRETAFRYWTLYGLYGYSERHIDMEKCDVYLKGYLNGLVDSGVITGEEATEIIRYIKYTRFKCHACDRLVTMWRTEEEKKEEES